MPEQGVFTRSDHYPFVKQGVPAVFLVTGYANGGEKIWHEFLGGAYHSPNDDLTQKIDWEAGVAVRGGELPDHAGHGGCGYAAVVARRGFLRRHFAPRENARRNERLTEADKHGACMPHRPAWVSESSYTTERSSPASAEI